MKKNGRGRGRRVPPPRYASADLPPPLTVSNKETILFLRSPSPVFIVKVVDHLVVKEEDLVDEDDLP